MSARPLNGSPGVATGRPASPAAGSTSTITIRPVEDGPLVVSGLSECRRDSGQRIAIEGTAYLCRCGGSADKPFCDGSHNRNGFSTADTAGARAHGPTRTFAGAQLTVLDTRSACARTGFCSEFSPRVFSPGRTPWIAPDAAAPEQVVRTVELCPSGALALKVEQLRACASAGGPAELHVLRDGPYCVIGPARLDAPLQPLDASRYTLCRCGGSANKPYCDGSHRRLGFRG